MDGVNRAHAVAVFIPIIIPVPLGKGQKSLAAALNIGIKVIFIGQPIKHLQDVMAGRSLDVADIVPLPAFSLFLASAFQLSINFIS
jgi:hypothetical protein